MNIEEFIKPTQAQLAEKCDKDKQSINRVEIGNINPSVFYLQQIAEALGVGLNELLKPINAFWKYHQRGPVQNLQQVLGPEMISLPPIRVIVSLYLHRRN